MSNGRKVKNVPPDGPLSVADAIAAVNTYPDKTDDAKQPMIDALTDGLFTARWQGGELRFAPTEDAEERADYAAKWRRDQEWDASTPLSVADALVALAADKSGNEEYDEAVKKVVGECIIAGVTVARKSPKGTLMFQQQEGSVEFLRRFIDEDDDEEGA